MDEELLSKLYELINVIAEQNQRLLAFISQMYGQEEEIEEEEEEEEEN